MQRIAEQVQKLVTTKEFFKDDLLEDNIPSEKATKKIHEVGNCELHEIQHRTNKEQCQRCYSYFEAGFQVCPCGGKLNMSEEVLSSIRQKFKQLIADAYMTFQWTRGVRHAAQPWQKHHFLAKEFMRKIHKKGMKTLFLDRFQNDEVFDASSYNITGQRNDANIWITSEQSIFRTMPLQNNCNDTLRCIIFGIIRNKWRKVVQIIIKLRGPLSA